MAEGELPKLLREFGQRTALRGGNPYRARAYYRAAENLSAVTEPLEKIIDEGRLETVPGIGRAIGDIVQKLHRTGTHPVLEAMRREVPAGVLNILSIPGLRPEKVLKIHHDLGVSSLEDLEQAAREGRLAKVKGLGPALERKVLQGLEAHRKSEGQRHLHRAAELFDMIRTNLQRSHPELDLIVPAGEFRRGCELVSDISVVARTARLNGGPSVVRLSENISLHITDRRRFGITLLLATGSKAHLAGLREIAAKGNMTLEERGLCRGCKIIAAACENEIYKALGMQPVPPELREGRGEIGCALAGMLPEAVTDADIRGILHAHTDRSDGVDTLETMAEATRANGYQYFGVADHSKSAHYAGGLSADEVAEQQLEADRLNEKYGSMFRIFKGIESDILPDGALDFPDGLLETFDFVVASVHGRFKLDRAAQTDRIIHAVANPHTTILGHMTGRQLLRRPGYEIDIEKVLTACADHGVAVEINANPWRLDLDWRWHETALQLGCLMSINPDAHSTREIDLTHWGVEMARKGGVPKERVLNCLSKAEFADYLERRRARRRGVSAVAGTPAGSGRLRDPKRASSRSHRKLVAR
jgi:DNA polymerase (family X)